MGCIGGVEDVQGLERALMVVRVDVLAIQCVLVHIEAKSICVFNW